MADTTPKFTQKGSEGRIVDDAPSIDNGLVLFSNRLCPFAHRAWWTIEELGIGEKIDYIHVELGPSKPAWYVEKVNPFGTVPALFDGGRPVFESLIVAEFLSEKFANADNSLLPADLLDRATVRLLIARWGDKCTRPLYGLLSNTDISKADELEDAVRAALTSFEQEIVKFAGADSDYLVGNKLTLADVAIVPFLERFVHTLAHYREFELLPDDGKHTRLRRVLETARSRPAYQKTTPPGDFIVWSYEAYGKERTPGRAARQAAL